MKQDINRIYSLILKHATVVKSILPDVLDEIVAIASKYSPSASFQRALLLAEMKGYYMEKLPLAKLTRWLAVIRRDYGGTEFNNIVNQIRGLFGVQSQNSNTQMNVSNMSSNINVGNMAMHGIVPGIYKYGKYDWLGETRVEKINAVLKEKYNMALPEELAQLALEIFHSLYLLNTELSYRAETDERLKAIAELTEGLRNNKEIREITVLDEFASIVATAHILSEILSNEETKKKLKKLTANKENINEAKKAICAAVAKAKAEARKAQTAKQILDSFAVGKVLHQIDFTAKVRLAELLSRYPVFTKTILEAIKTIKEEPGMVGDTIEFSGYKKMESYSELARTRLTEHVYPETVYIKRLAQKELQVRKYEEGVRGRKRKYIVLIDKSGSMGAVKLEKAKAVAISLLLSSKTDDVLVAFFDTYPYPEDEPFRVTEDFLNTLEKVLSVRSDGGTNIDRALQYADRHAPGYTIILITDGEDYVTYKPKNKLITIFVNGHNEVLKQISEKYFDVDDITGKTVRKILD